MLDKRLDQSRIKTAIADYHLDESGILHAVCKPEVVNSEKYDETLFAVRSLMKGKKRLCW